MRAAPRIPANDADVQALADAIRAATAEEIDALARTLLATADTHPFGTTEFTRRDLAHCIAAVEAIRLSGHARNPIPRPTEGIGPQVRTLELQQPPWVGWTEGDLRPSAAEWIGLPRHARDPVRRPTEGIGSAAHPGNGRAEAGLVGALNELRLQGRWYSSQSQCPQPDLFSHG
jgi:hypothetical protein